MFELIMTAGDKVHGKKAAGAPFNVYLRKAAAAGVMDGVRHRAQPPG